MRNLLKVNDNFRNPCRQFFPGADIERNACPAPVVNEKSHGNKSFGARIRTDARFFAIPPHVFTFYFGGNILAPHHRSGHIVARYRADGLKNLYDFIADGIGFNHNRRFHSNKSHQLKQVVLQHIAQGACLFVVAAAPFHAKVFGRGNLHPFNEITVP